MRERTNEWEQILTAAYLAGREERGLEGLAELTRGIIARYGVGELLKAIYDQVLPAADSNEVAQKVEQGLYKLLSSI